MNWSNAAWSSSASRVRAGVGILSCLASPRGSAAACSLVGCELRGSTITTTATAARQATAHAARADRLLAPAACFLVRTGSGSGSTGRKFFRYFSNCSSFGSGIRVLLHQHRFAELGERVAVARGCGVRADAQYFCDLRERQFPPDVKNDDLPLVIRQRLKGAAKIFFRGVVAVGRREPQAIGLDRNVPLSRLLIVQETVAHAREEICLRVEGILDDVGLYEFEEHLMHGVLCATGFATDADGEKKQRSAVLTIQAFDVRQALVGWGHLSSLG